MRIGRTRIRGLGLFDVDFIHLPQRPETHRIMVVRERLIYINTGAAPDANVYRKFETRRDFALFVRAARE